MQLFCGSTKGDLLNQCPLAGAPGPEMLTWAKCCSFTMTHKTGEGREDWLFIYKNRTC